MASPYKRGPMLSGGRYGVVQWWNSGALALKLTPPRVQTTMIEGMSASHLVLGIVFMVLGRCLLGPQARRWNTTVLQDQTKPKKERKPAYINLHPYSNLLESSVEAAA